MRDQELAGEKVPDEDGGVEGKRESVREKKMPHNAAFRDTLISITSEPGWRLK